MIACNNIGGKLCEVNYLLTLLSQPKNINKSSQIVILQTIAKKLLTKPRENAYNLNQYSTLQSVKMIYNRHIVNKRGANEMSRAKLAIDQYKIDMDIEDALSGAEIVSQDWDAGRTLAIFSDQSVLEFDAELVDDITSNVQIIDGKHYKITHDYAVDNYQDSWAMYAYALCIETLEKVSLRVIPTDSERVAIDNGDAELDFIDYSAPEVLCL